MITGKLYKSSVINFGYMSSIGCLFLVPTPIGNLQDITQRSVQTLADVDLVAAEDTRHSGLLLQHLGIKAKLVALHEHNEAEKSEWLIEHLLAGKNIALISDAGMPLINDPGYVLVSACRARNIPLTALPGPCALITALAGSGLPTHNFAFFGFLPVKTEAKRKALLSQIMPGQTAIYYEAPRRIVDTIEHCQKYLPQNAELVIAKELSKTFETYVCGTAQDILTWLHADANHSKGEFVLLIHLPVVSNNNTLPQEAITLLQSLVDVVPPKKACGIVAQHYNLSKNKLYKHYLENGAS